MSFFQCSLLLWRKVEALGKMKIHSEKNSANDCIRYLTRVNCITLDQFTKLEQLKLDLITGFWHEMIGLNVVLKDCDIGEVCEKMSKLKNINTYNEHFTAGF